MRLYYVATDNKLVRTLVSLCPDTIGNVCDPLCFFESLSLVMHPLSLHFQHALTHLGLLFPLLMRHPDQKHMLHLLHPGGFGYLGLDMWFWILESPADEGAWGIRHFRWDWSSRPSRAGRKAFAALGA